MKVQKNYLSPKEYEIMTIFWSMDKPLTASEILQHRKEGTWAANSIHPLLNKLLENGYIVDLRFAEGGEGEQPFI